MWKNKRMWYNGKKIGGTRDEKNTVDVGILDIVPGFCENKKEIAGAYAIERIYRWMLEIGFLG